MCKNDLRSFAEANMRLQQLESVNSNEYFPKLQSFSAKFPLSDSVSLLDSNKKKEFCRLLKRL